MQAAERALEEMEQAGKDMQQAAVEMEEAANVMQADLPHTLEAMEDASRCALDRCRISRLVCSSDLAGSRSRENH